MMVTNIKKWQERLGPDYLYSPLERRILEANAEIAELRAYAAGLETGTDALNNTIAELRAALEAKDKEIEQAAKLSRDWALDYAAMHFDGLPACPGVYAAEYLLGLKDAPMDIAPIMEALEKAKGQK